MSTILLAYGVIEGPVEVKMVGTPPKKLVTFGLNDGTGPAYQVEAWKETADALPPVGTFVVIQGRLSSRSYKKRDGSGEGKALSVTAFRIDPIGPGFVAPRPPVAPAAPSAAFEPRTPNEAGFGD